MAEAHGGTGYTTLSAALKVILDADGELLKRDTGGTLIGITLEDALELILTGEADVLSRNSSGVAVAVSPPTITALDYRVPLVLDPSTDPELRYDRFYSPLHTRRQMQILADATDATLTVVGFPSSKVTEHGTASNADLNFGPLVRYVGAGSVGDLCGWETEFDLLKFQWSPSATWAVRTFNSADGRQWLGFTSATFDGAGATPTGFDYAAFRFDDVVDTGATWRAVSSSGGGSSETTDTGVSIGSLQNAWFRIEVDNYESEVRFYITDFKNSNAAGLVATHSTEFPAGVCGAVYTNEQIAATTGRTVQHSRWGCEHD
ncbi:MAG: hypothetical protein VW405_00140 [Rhodospirillaceae bacterium]